MDSRSILAFGIALIALGVLPLWAETLIGSTEKRALEACESRAAARLKSCRGQACAEAYLRDLELCGSWEQLGD